MKPIEQIKQEIAQSDGLLIAAANGFSIAEGFAILMPTAWFDEQFSDFVRKYGFRAPIQALSYPYPSEEDFNTLFSRMVSLIHYDKPVSPLMKDLQKITENHPAFILTTNSEDRFEQAGYPARDVFYLEGRMTHRKDGSFIAREELPLIRSAADLETDQYVGSSSFQEGMQRLERFIRIHPRLLILELGVGQQNQLIRPLLFQIMDLLPQARMAILNQSAAIVPFRYQNRVIEVQGSLTSLITDLAYAR